MSVAKLVPLLDVDDETDKRPMLRIYPDCPIVIGRNDINTMIELKHVSRELLRLEWRAETLYAAPLKTDHYVRVGDKPLTGETALNHGDVLSLWKESYSYQVRFSEVATSSSELTPDAKRKLTDHVACPICMELLVSAMILVPCGHRFCKQCCEAAECASCRTVVQSRIKDRCLDGLVLELVQERCLDADDSAVYLKRIGKEPLRTVEARSQVYQTPNKRRRRNRTHAPEAHAIPENADIICLT